MIRNTSKDEILMPKSAVMRSYFSKSTGLMFHSRVEKGLVFPFKKPRKILIHMLMVFCPIDILFLNDQNKIVEIAQDVKPFNFYKSRHNITTFIELPRGKVKETNTKVGDHIAF